MVDRHQLELPILLSLQQLTVIIITTPLSRVVRWPRTITTMLHREVDRSEAPGTTHQSTLYLALVALTPSTQVKN